MHDGKLPIIYHKKYNIQTPCGLEELHDFDTQKYKKVFEYLIKNKVINWSHQNNKARFRVDVGVAYGSDVEKVIKVLVESANEHADTVDKKMTHARLTNFGNSSLDFQVLFYSKNIFRIERIKSEIRRIINRKFIENNITIPFPQVDLHIKSDNTKKKN